MYFSQLNEDLLTYFPYALVNIQPTKPGELKKKLWKWVKCDVYTRGVDKKLLSAS